MAKNCLNKLSGNITVGCTINPVGVKAIYLMHSKDVTLRYAENGCLMGVVFADGAKSYLVEGYKQNIQVTASLKTTDASARVDQSVTFKMQYGTGFTVSSNINSIASGTFLVLVEFNNGDYTVLGATVPLECSSVDFDSNANARLITFTLASPEGSAGNRAVPVDGPVRDLIISKSV